MAPDMPSWLRLMLDELTTPPHFLHHSPSGKKQDKSSAKKAESTSQEVKSTGSKAQRPTSLPVKKGNDVQPASTSSDTAVRPAQAEKPRASVLDAYRFHVIDEEDTGRVKRLKTSKGTYALKETSMAPERIRYIDRMLDYAQSHGFEDFSPIIPTASGDLSVEGANSQRFYLTEWIKGRPLRFSAISDIGLAARSLARFHEATRGFPARGFSPPNAFGLYDLLRQRAQELTGCLRQAQGRGSIDPVDALLVTHAQSIDQQSESALSMLRESSTGTFLQNEAKHSGICHLDVTSNHLVYTAAPKVTLIHFDSAAPAPRVLDLAHLIRRGMQTQRWKPEVALVSLVQYNAVRGLSRGDYRVLEALLTFPHRLWHLVHRHYTQKRKLGVELFEDFFSQEEERRRFLESFARQVTRSQR